MTLIATDLSTDPHETENLAAREPERLAEAQRRLEAWHDGMMKSMPFGYDVDPLDTVLQEGGPEHARLGRADLKAYAQRLRDTGRGHWVAQLETRHPGGDW